MGRLIRALIALVALVSVAGAGVENVSVTTEGEGKSLEEAINVALVQAIANIRGKQLASVTTSTSVQANAKLSMDSSASLRDSRGRNDSVRLKTDSSANFEGNATERVTAESVQGAVKSYKVLDKRSSATGWWVKVEAQIPDYVLDASAERVRVAVLPFRASTEQYSWGENALLVADVKRGLTQHMSRQLVQSEKFTVLDREFDAEIAAESDLIMSGKTSTQDAARLGQQLATDYVLVGTVDSLSLQKKERQLRASQRKVLTVTAQAKVSFRLVSATTRQAVASENVNVILNNNDIRGDDPNLLYQAVSRDILKNILDRMYPTTLISVDGKQVVVGQGGATVSSGETYKVYRLGRELLDPHTQEVIGRQESYCCQIRIERVTPRFANGIVTEGQMDLAREFQPGRFIVREEVEVQRAKAPRAVKEQREAIRKRREEPDDDW
jgi:TolB-like protein